MKELIHSLTPIILIILTVVGMTLFVLIRSNLKNIVKLLLIPVTIIAVGVVPVMFVQLMGYAVSLELPEKALIIAHKTVIIQTKKTFIDIWMQTKAEARLYRAPYSKQLEELLESAEDARKQGMIPRLKREGQSRNKGENTDGDDYTLPFSIELLKPEDIAPKELGEEAAPVEEPDEKPNRKFMV